MPTSPYRSALLRLLLGIALPACLTLAFYALQQKQLRRPVHEPHASAAMPPAQSGLQFSLDAVPAGNRKRWRVAGWVADETGAQRRLLQPSLLVVGPDGRGVEFATRPRRANATPSTEPNAHFQGFDGFEGEIKRRHLPRAQPLKLLLAVSHGGQRQLLDTGVVLDRSQP